MAAGRDSRQHRGRQQGGRLRWSVPAAAVLALAVGAPFAAAAPAPSSGGFSARPAHFDANVPATRAYFIRWVRPGASFRDEVVVTNPSTHPLKLYVNAVDGLTGVTSGSVYANRQDPRHKAGRWVTPQSGEITVAPESHVLVPFTVNVPSAATPGDHLAGLALENAAPVHGQGRFSVTEIVRAVVGVEIKVPGRQVTKLALGKVTLAALPGTQIPSAVIRISNTGTKLCKPKLSVTLSGARSETVVRQLDTILPGDTIPFPLELPRALPAGSYHATVQASDCGALTQIAQTVTLAGSLRGTNTNPTATPAVVEDGAVHTGSMPMWELPLIAFGGVSLGVVFTRVLRSLLSWWRRRRAEAHFEPVQWTAPPPPVPGADYHGLARPRPIALAQPHTGGPPGI